MTTKNRRIWQKLTCVALLTLNTITYAAGTLSPKGGGAPLEIKDHKVDVVINNGFAKVEVGQTFYNQHNQTSEGIYSFPLPKSASLSEVRIMIGESVIEGEVVAKEKANKIYEEEKKAGNEAGKAEKNGFQDFKFFVANIPALSEARISFVYYQPLKIDTGMGRFLYPLEEGGTDEMAESFWTSNDKVSGKISFNIELKSSAPLSGVRCPSLQPVAKDLKLDAGQAKVSYEIDNGTLGKDFVFYYRLKTGLPGSVEVIPYKAAKDKEGTFMMVVTPGEDLKPLTNGSDYLFILDKSGSMQGKVQTLNAAVNKALGKMKAKDRFRIFTFNDRSDELTSDWVLATPENVKKWSKKVDNISANGGTNMYEGIAKPLRKLDADRVTSVILVTDAVTNTGEVNPIKFAELMRKYDIRLFGFLLGNSTNWPLMQTLCEVSGGFYDGISNADDIVGKILQAKEKVAYECMHDTELKISGVKTSQTTNMVFRKVYRGEQLVVFGRYNGGGKATFTMNSKVSGQEKEYEYEINLPEVDTENPELERIWAMSQVEMYDQLAYQGQVKEKEFENMAREIGVNYQIVTDETSMLVLSDAAFTKHGIDRKNRERTKVELKAQAARRQTSTIANNSQPKPRPRQAKKRRGFKLPRPSIGGGGGAVGPIAIALLSMWTGLGFYLKRKEG